MKFRVTLSHVCNKPGLVGVPGDVLEVRRVDMEYLRERGGIHKKIEKIAEANDPKEPAAKDDKPKGK